MAMSGTIINCECPHSKLNAPLPAPYARPPPPYTAPPQAYGAPLHPAYMPYPGYSVPGNVISQKQTTNVVVGAVGEPDEVCCHCCGCTCAVM